MQAVLTITSKGQTTIPVAMRRQLGLSKDGGTLSIYLGKGKGTAIITKPLSIEELSQRVSQNIKPGAKPVLNVDEYYQEHRRVSY